MEDEIRKLISKEKEWFNREGRQLDIFGWSLEQFEKEASNEEYWKTLEHKIIESFNEFARLQAEQGKDESYFTGEATKGLRLLDVMLRQYDIVVTNPPYLDVRDYNSRLKSFMESAYPNSKRNLYAAFLERCLEFLKPGARLGIITPQTFMFITSFEKVRERLRGSVAIESLVHTGLNTFEDTVVDCAFYILRREAEAKKRQNAAATYFRLVREPDALAKRKAFESAVAALQHGENYHQVYHYQQGDFDAIPDSPWVYWITPGIRQLFIDLPKLGDIAQPRQGLATADNFRFLRFWWEVGRSRIAFGCKNHLEAQATQKKWFPYMKGGAYRKWYGNQEYVVNWYKDGLEIKNLVGENGRVASRPQNTDFYFREGVTWSFLSSKGLSVRYLPYGFIFADKGESAFGISPFAMLACMNSCVFNYLMSFISPTVDFHCGYIAKAPFINIANLFNVLVEQGIHEMKKLDSWDEATFNFIIPPPLANGSELVAERWFKLAELEEKINKEVYRLYGLSEEDWQIIDEELSKGSISAIDSKGEELESEVNGNANDKINEEQSLKIPMTHQELAMR